MIISSIIVRISIIKQLEHCHMDHNTSVAPYKQRLLQLLKRIELPPQGGDTPIYSVLRSSFSVKMKVKGQPPK